MNNVKPDRRAPRPGTARHRGQPRRHASPSPCSAANQVSTIHHQQCLLGSTPPPTARRPGAIGDTTAAASTWPTAQQYHGGDQHRQQLVVTSVPVGCSSRRPSGASRDRRRCPPVLGGMPTEGTVGFAAPGPGGLRDDQRQSILSRHRRVAAGETRAELNTATGVISGTPLLAGAAIASVTPATRDGPSNADSIVFSIAVPGGVPPRGNLVGTYNVSARLRPGRQRQSRPRACSRDRPPSCNSDAMATNRRRTCCTWATTARPCACSRALTATPRLPSRWTSPRRTVARRGRHAARPNLS